MNAKMLAAHLARFADALAVHVGFPPPGRLKARHAAVLSALSGGPRSVGDTQQAVNIRLAPTMSRALDELFRPPALLRCEFDPADRRRRLLSVMPAGWKELDDYRLARTLAAEQAIATLGTDYLAELLESLTHCRTAGPAPSSPASAAPAL